MCLDEKAKGLKLLGDEGSMITSNVVFKIDKCNPSRISEPCFDDNAIRNFIYDLQIDSWVLQDKMDFSLFDVRPTYKVMENKGRTLLDPDFILKQYNYLERHSINLYDNVVNMDTPTFVSTFF